MATITSEFGEERFGYDFADRLVTRKTTTGIRSEPLAFVYAGDRLTQAFQSGSTVPQFAVGYDDQSNASAVSRYDGAGAALASTLCLVHDALGRLVLAGYAAPGSGGPDVLACRCEADVQEVIARFTNDAMGRRVSRRDANGRWTYFTFDLQGNPSSEVLISGDGLAPARDYVFLDGGPLVQFEYPGPTSSGGAPYFFHVDHLNRPRARDERERAGGLEVERAPERRRHRADRAGQREWARRGDEPAAARAVRRAAAREPRAPGAVLQLEQVVSAGGGEVLGTGPDCGGRWVQRVHHA